MQTVTETITPEVAKSYLRLNNPNNRKISPRVVEDYARQMRRGEFRLTHQGIGFLTDGTLGDGQHRLLGIVKSGCPVQMQVTRGLTQADILAVDRGKTRSVSDVVRIAGADGDHGNLKDAKLSSAISQLISCNTNRAKLNANDIIRVYSVFRQQADYIYENVITKACGKGVGSTVLAAAIAAMYCGVEAEYIRQFFEVYTRADIAGCDGLNIQAPLYWRRQVDSSKAKHVSISRAKMYLGVQNAIYHFVNNSGVYTVRVPATPRYDVKNRIAEILSPQE